MGSESAAGLLCLFPAHYGDNNAEDKRLYINTGWMGAVVCCEASVLVGAAEPSSTFKCDQQHFVKWEKMLTGPPIVQLMKPVWALIDLKLRLLLMLATFVIYCDMTQTARLSRSVRFIYLRVHMTGLYCVKLRKLKSWFPSQSVIMRTSPIWIVNFSPKMQRKMDEYKAGKLDESFLDTLPCLRKMC